MNNTEPKRLTWSMTGTADEVAHILTDFANDLRRGDLTVWKEEQELHIDPAGDIKVSVKAGHETGHDGLTITLDWSKPS